MMIWPTAIQKSACMNWSMGVAGLGKQSESPSSLVAITGRSSAGSTDGGGPMQRPPEGGLASQVARLASAAYSNAFNSRAIGSKPRSMSRYLRVGSPEAAAQAARRCRCTSRSTRPAPVSINAHVPGSGTGTAVNTAPLTALKLKLVKV